MSVNSARSGKIAGLIGAAILIAGVLLIGPIGIPTARAQCPAIEVSFARGTNDPPGPGKVGQAFIDALRSRVGGRDVGQYAVNYAASMNFLLTADGVTDTVNHVNYMVANCPDTRLVLGGYSQGAAVMDVATGVSVPGLTGSALPPEADGHVAAVAVFANLLDKIAGPLSSMSPVYGGRTIDLCISGDPICGPGTNMNIHHQYIGAMTDQAADFVAGRV